MSSTDLSLFAYEESDKKEKSPNALRTISEASELLDVPQHVLRFWETKFPQIKPLKRNGGRRFYRPQDLDVLQQIKHLLYSQGYTIKGAKKAVDDFIHARSVAPVNATEWIATLPPANVNDNFAAAEEQSMPDLLAEIADAINEPELVADASGVVVDQETVAKLRALRNELATLRDSLRLQLPAASALVQ